MDINQLIWELKKASVFDSTLNIRVDGRRLSEICADAADIIKADTALRRKVRDLVM